MDLGGASTILTQDQILKIDAALKSEQIKSGPNPLLQVPTQDSIESMAIEEPEDHQQEEEEEKIQLNIDSVLNIGAGSFSTKHLMNQVMSSEILMEAIGDDGIMVAAAVAVPQTTSDGESENGSTTDSTSEKKMEDNLKRRSSRIAHITANDLTLRQSMREKEQKKKEREEKKRQKEEERKAKDSKNVTVVESGSDSPDAPKEKGVKGGDISSEIAKYLMVIDQEIKQSEAQKEEDPAGEKEGSTVKKEESAVKKEDEKEQEGGTGEEKKTSLNLFESLSRDASKKKVKEDIVNETTAGDKKEKPDEPSQRTSDAESKKAGIGEVEEKSLDTKDELELGEVKEEKETGELSDDEEAHLEPKTSVYWMDHSYAAASQVLPTTSSAPAADPVVSPTKRSTRRDTRKAKSAEESSVDNTEEKKDEDKPRRSSRRESKVSKEEEIKETKQEKKVKSKHDRKDKESSKDKDKEDSRSRSKEKSSSKEKERHRSESRSKSVDDKEKDKKKKKHKEKNKEKDEKKDKEKDEKKDESRKKKSSKSSREVKKTKLGKNSHFHICFNYFFLSICI